MMCKIYQLWINSSLTFLLRHHKVKFPKVTPDQLTGIFRDGTPLKEKKSIIIFNLK